MGPQGPDGSITTKELIMATMSWYWLDSAAKEVDAAKGADATKEADSVKPQKEMKSSRTCSVL